jgi:hypothetical protein
MPRSYGVPTRKPAEQSMSDAALVFVSLFGLAIVILLVGAVVIFHAVLG